MNATKAVLVTGATSGIGEAICWKFGRNGYRVLAHVRDEQRGDTFVKSLRADDIEAECLVADLREEGAANALISQIETLGTPLVDLVNNAGGVVENVFMPGHVEDPSLSYEVNVFAAYALSVLAAERMENGSIVNISSAHAHSPWGTSIPHYSASKAALSHLTKMLAIKLAPNVRVNAVSPGRTRTTAWGALTPEADAALAEDQLIKRWIDADEVADAVWFLSQNKACTGTDLLIDGGMSLSPVLTNT